MSRRSAGILMYRIREGNIEVLLVHPGGPFGVHKDNGAWSIPKGEFDQGEDSMETARREFHEETGYKIEGNLLALTPIKQRSGKTVYAWAIEGDCDADAINSNTFKMEWPRHSGIEKEFPEVDRAAWYVIKDAYEKILPGQHGLLDQLIKILAIEDNSITLNNTSIESERFKSMG